MRRKEWAQFLQVIEAPVGANLVAPRAFVKIKVATKQPSGSKGIIFLVN